MDYATLLALIDADPSLVALAEAGDCIGVAAALNEPAVDVSRPYQLTTLGVLDVLGPMRGTAVLTALRQLPEFGEIVKLMDQVGAGVNLDHPDADAMFALLVSGSVLTQVESDSILALRTVRVGRAEHAVGVPITHVDVGLALAGRGP